VPLHVPLSEVQAGLHPPGSRTNRSMEHSLDETLVMLNGNTSCACFATPAAWISGPNWGGPKARIKADNAPIQDAATENHTSGLLDPSPKISLFRKSFLVRKYCTHDCATANRRALPTFSAVSPDRLPLSLFGTRVQTRKFLPLRSSSVLERRMHPAQSPLPWPENGFPTFPEGYPSPPVPVPDKTKKFSALPTGFRESHACYLYTRGNRCSRLSCRAVETPRRCERRLFMVARTVVLRRRLGRISPGPTLFQPVFPIPDFSFPGNRTFSTCSPVTLNGSGRKSPAPRGNCSQPRRAPLQYSGACSRSTCRLASMWAVSIKLSARVPRLNKNIFRTEIEKNMKVPYGLDIIEKLQRLRHCSLRVFFCGLSSSALQSLNQVSHKSNLPAGAILFVEGGKVPAACSFLCSGKVNLSTTSREGKILIS